MYPLHAARWPQCLCHTAGHLAFNATPHPPSARLVLSPLSCLFGDECMFPGTWPSFPRWWERTTTPPKILAFSYVAETYPFQRVGEHRCAIDICLAACQWMRTACSRSGPLRSERGDFAFCFWHASGPAMLAELRERSPFTGKKIRKLQKPKLVPSC